MVPPIAAAVRPDDGNPAGIVAVEGPPEDRAGRLVLRMPSSFPLAVAPAAGALLLAAACWTTQTARMPPVEPVSPDDAVAPATTAIADSDAAAEQPAALLPEPRPFLGRPIGRVGRGRSWTPLPPECFDGAIPPDHVRRVLEMNRGRIRHCYQDALLDDRSVAGRMVVAFVVATTGEVGDVEVEVNETANDALADCVGDTVASLRFLCNAEGARFRYPVVLRPQE
jgi:hypothetical protein